MKTSITSVTSSSTATSPWAKTPEWYQTNLRALLATHVHRLQSATGLTLDQIARERLGWSRGNNFTQLTQPKYKSILSPASALQMAKALELDNKETDELVIATMRANSGRLCEMTPEFLSRYEKSLARRLCAAAKKRGIRLS
ncbi:hypothetical protein [Methylomonas koyamae]|uniref:hypothetical protein n=1 Tax=Methylomonas koyamae TaxID=702114 RepID=UPI001125EE5E|nr:hypothetical protein [Methylomonas koyamae]